MPPPAQRRLLRAGAGASPGLHGLAPGSSARWSAKATPGKGTPPPPLWSREPGHLHPVKHSPKRPVVRGPGAHSSLVVPAPRCSSCPAALLPTPCPARARVGGGGGEMVWVGSWDFNWPRSAVKEVGSESGRAGVPGRGHPDTQRVHDPCSRGGVPSWRLGTGRRALRLGGSRSVRKRGRSSRPVG